MFKQWTDEKLNEAKSLMKFKSASETGEILNKTKNSVLGVLYREKVKNGYVPPSDSKYTSTKSHGRGVKSTSVYYKGKKVGERPCNMCQKMFDMHSRFDRFCSTCRRNLPYVA